MFGIGGFELFVILVFGFLIFGPDKLPDMARTVGKAIGRFRSAQEEMNEVISTSDFYDPNDKEQPFKDPTIALDKMARHQEEKRAAKAAKAPAAETKAESASAPADTSGAADATGADAPAQDEAPRQESFSERKARYERERAARKAAEAQAAADAEAAETQAAADAEAAEGGER